MPLRIIKNPLVSLNEDSDFDLFRLRWNTEENTTPTKLFLTVIFELWNKNVINVENQ